ncbi:hypothetical protein AB7076_07850 [Providencia rettgeri]
MLDLNSMLSVIIGGAIPLCTQLVIFYVSNRESNENKKLVKIQLATNIVIKLTNFINDSYEYIKSPIVTNNDGHDVRVHGIRPSFSLDNGIDLNFLNKDLTFRILVIPNRIKYIECKLDQYFYDLSPDSDEFINIANNEYKDILIEVISIREQVCQLFDFPMDKIYDMSDIYSAP